ncbi:MAG: L,D-transpeptidase family protein [Pseudomonadota bacterium]
MRAARVLHGAALAGALLVLTGCSLLQPGFGPDTSRADAPQVPITFDGAPQTEHVFEITDAAQSVYGEVQVIEARDADTFSDIARSYGLGYDELVHANPEVDPWLPGAGTRIVLPTRFVLPDAPREGIVLNIAAKRLFAFQAATETAPATVTSYPIGIGRVGWATPIGSSEVIAKATDPAWYVPASVRAEHRALGDPLPAIVPPGPDNPLGRHVLKLDMPGYLLHGTNQPYGVGMRVSHGCVRLYPEDIEVLYGVTGLGTRVTIVNEPVSVGVRDGVTYVVVHPQLEDDERAWQDLAAAGLAAFEQPDVEVTALVADGVARAMAVRDPLQQRYVSNVAAPPADAPDRETVARLLDELMQEDADADSAEPEVSN